MPSVPKTSYLSLFIAPALTAASITGALANEPRVSGEVVLELQTEHGYDSDDPDNERNNTFGRMEVAPTFRINKNFFVDGVLVFEPIGEGNPGDDLFFEHEGAFIEEIKLNYENGPWAAFAGKFNPGFGIAWDFGRGIWGEDFAEDYEITEKIGFGGTYTYENEQLGSHTFTASTFFADTSILSRSVITSRDDVDESDGGASNTNSFKSFVVSVDGENVGGIENLSYKLGYRHLAAGDADVGADDEKGVVATVNYVFPVHQRVTVDALVEYAHINNFDGGMDDYRYLTGSLITTLDEKWNVTVGYTDRDINVSGGEDIDDHLLQVSGGYLFDCGLSVEVGWRTSEEEDVENNIVGALARYSSEF